MRSSFEKYQKRRLLSSYFSVIISMTSVLFLLGLLAFLVLNTQKMVDYLKEKIVLTAYLKDTAKSVEIKRLQKSLTLAKYTKKITFVSKETAAENYSKQIGENFMEFLGYNPLQNAIDIYLHADFVSAPKVKKISNELLPKSIIDEIIYDQNLIEILDNKIQTIRFWIAIASAVLTAIAVLLINSSIRLSVYSKRFTIKTMQMVGATKSRIRRPFIRKHISLGIISGIFAIFGAGIVLYYLYYSFPEFAFLVADYKLLLALALGIILAGMGITWISTFFATQRFLNLRTEELYY